MLTIDNVYRARNALKGVARKTDVIFAPKFSKDAQVYLKTEQFYNAQQQLIKVGRALFMRAKPFML